MAKRPICETPGCGRPIPKGGEGHPEICPTCLACLRLHGASTPVVPKVKPEMTVEWQVTPGDTGTTHIFHTQGAVFGFLASEWERFCLSWVATRTCRLALEVRRVEREKHAR